MLKVRKRLVSALCAFVVGASSNLVALPQFNYSAFAGLSGDSGSSGSSGKVKKRSFGKKPDGPVMSAVKQFASPTLGVGSVAIVGDTLGVKGLEFFWNRYLLTGICWMRNPTYRVLLKRFNLLQKANEIVELGKKVKSIERGLSKIKKYFCDEKGGLIEKDKDGNDIKDFGGFAYSLGGSEIKRTKLSFDGDIAAALCQLLAIGYSCKDSKNLRDDDFFDRTIELGKRVFVPFSVPREGFCFEFDEKTKSHLHCKDDESALESSGNIRYFTFAEDTRWKIEGYFHGYGRSVAFPFNVYLVKNFFAKSLNVGEVENEESGKQGARDFLNNFNDVKSKKITISEDNAKKCSCRLSGNKLLLDIEAKVGDDDGTLQITYTIPDGKGNVDITGLFSMKFTKKN